MAGASGGAIKAGQAWVGLGVVDTVLVKGLEAARKKVLDFGKKTASIGLKLTATGSTMLAPIAAAFKASFNRASDIKDLSDRFKMTAESVSTLAYAFERGGVDLDGFASTFDGLQAKMFAAADGSDETFRRLGINARALMKMPDDKAFLILLDRVNSLVDPIDRATVGTEVFGSAWNQLSNSSLKSRDALNALRREAVEVGAVISGEDAARGKEITLSLTEAWQALKYAVLEVGMALLGYSGDIADIAGSIRNAAGQARDWIKENRGLVITIAAIGAGLVAAGAAVLAFSSVCTALGTILGVVAVAVKLLSGALALLFSPGGLILIGVVAVAALCGAFDGMGEIFGEAWGGIMAAISSGDLSLALKVAQAAMEAIWATLVANLTEMWVEFKNVVVDGWHWIVDHLAAGVSVLKAGVTWITEGGDAARNQLEGEINEMQKIRAHEQAERDAFRAKQVNDARDREAAARAELTAFVNRAKAGAGGGGGGGGPGGAGGGETSSSIGPNGENLNLHLGANPATLYGAAKGTFGSYSGDSIGQQLRYGDTIAARQLETAGKILEANKQLVQMIGGIGAVAWK